MTDGRRGHDVGGLSAGPVDPSHHAEKRWEIEVTATFGALLGRPRRIIRLDELRRAVEDLGEDAYNRLGYFERQTQATADILVEKGVLSRDEIERRMAAIRRRGGGGE